MAKAFPNTGATVIDSVADLPAASAALEGIMMFQKDTNELKICDGSNWVSVADTNNRPLAAWADYTPTWYGVTVGDGTTDAKYVKVGKHVTFYAKFTLGSTSAITGQIGVTLPVTSKSTASGVFNGFFTDAGAGFPGMMTYPSGTTGITCYAVGSSGSYTTAAVTSSTIPHTWAINDAIWVGGVYEAA